MYTPRYSKAFKKSYKKLRKSGRFSREDVEKVVVILAKGEKLTEKYQDHTLVGKMEGYRECHIKPDLLLIYKIEKQILVLILINIGSHSELFG
ncbi:MAG: type II toxin-antitoxin system YafQ family toxin [Candidatus Pacebacteria bacterium]|nr:type II toxin-antitoxin system YafQ family toxin [Candidatus Paceibacterota bacterium]